MIRALRCLALLAVALPGLPVRAQQAYPYTDFGVAFSTDEAWYRQCMRVEKVALPPADRGASPDCDADAMYYTTLHQATTSPAQWRAVRACASAKGDNMVLMMLFANGFGVARDTDVAIHYACQPPFAAKAEMEGRIAHLATLPAGSNKPFDQCDDITSGRMGAICAASREDQDERVRLSRLGRLAASLAPPSRVALIKLRARAEKYAQSAMDEVDMHGTAAPALALERGAFVREQAMQAMLHAAAGKLPVASGADDARRDAGLNVQYKLVMALASQQQEWPDRIGQSTIARKDVRAAEREWLAYRDAFIAFAATLPSGPDAASVRSLLTAQRTALLVKVAEYR
jgi:hypothetical protein